MGPIRGVTDTPLVTTRPELRSPAWQHQHLHLHLLRALGVLWCQLLLRTKMDQELKWSENSSYIIYHISKIIYHTYVYVYIYMHK